MAIIDMNNWSFEFGAGHPACTALGLATVPTVLGFNSALDLLIYLSGHGSYDTPIQRLVGERLKADTEVANWHRLRDYLYKLRHYPKYKKSRYDAYHEAARKLAIKSATARQVLLANGLNAEIAASRVVVPGGQVLFHGRADFALSSTPNYSRFISTTLDPVVAICSALRRAGLKSVSRRPIVYILTVRDPLPGLWGNGGKPREWEVLFQSGLACRATNSHPGSRFDIVEASLGI